MSDAKWYVIHTYAGYEGIVKANIEQMVKNNNLGEMIFDIKIPLEQAIEEHNGKKKVVEVKSMPCYVFIKCIYSPHIGYLITTTRGVTGFVGPQGKAWPLEEDEVRRFKLEVVKYDFKLAIGDNVNVISGAFEGLIGSIKSIDQLKQKVTVALNMFGREAEVGMDFDQIASIEAK
ncbi:MAG: transcription termination/antitermination protein NusG [Clostridia bacterium]